jgi:hypothetical protein
MSIFDFFKRANKQSDINNLEKDPLQEIKKEDFIDDSDPKKEINTYSIVFGSKLPIDVIYSFLKEDYESKAYNDAMTNPDRSYKEINMSIIRSNLEVKFKQVALKYEDMLRDLDFHIESRSQAGLTDIVEMLRSKKHTYEKHLDELRQMRADLESGELYMIGIFKSYEVGFTRGLASLSLDNLKNQ